MKHIIGNFMQGILIINKPKGFTSQDTVSKVKKILNVKKAGHTGTLDPMATGILPILIGNYTKLSKYLIEHDKTYIARIKLGEKTDTGDSEGKVIETKEVKKENLNEENLTNAIKSFLGEQLQLPPIYSAIKIDGKKLYEYAREGKKVEIPERKIKIYDINLLNFDENALEIEFEVSCSKGTYIRVLCENIAEKLETVGYMKSLVRTKVDNFKLENSITLDELEKQRENQSFLENKFIKMEDIFNNYPKIILDNRKKELFLNGVMLSFDLENGIYNIYNDNKYLGIGIVKEKLLKRDIIL